MKGVILHGGNGTRLRPLTYTDVKQLLPLAGKPVSEYALQNLIEIGITEVNIIVGEIGEKEVREVSPDAVINAAAYTNVESRYHTLIRASHWA